MIENRKVRAAWDTAIDFGILLTLTALTLLVADALGAALVWLLAQFFPHHPYGIGGYALLGFFWGVPALFVLFLVVLALRGLYRENLRRLP